ncbi:MAG: hypothetical protein J6K58_07830 [Lachnospiraceae bacterium]|nr:hypothetical protein [Lachnospiraceae bacterium]
MKENNFYEFTEELKNRLYKKLGENIRIDIHETSKNNDVTYSAMAILYGECNMTPNIRLDGFYHSYKEGISMEEIAEDILEIYRSSRHEKIDVSFFTDFEKAKGHILFKIIGYDRNRERLKKIPHIKFLDLALTFYFNLELPETSGGNASVQIENQHLEMWKIDEGTLYDLAKENTIRKMPVRCQTVYEIILEILGNDGIRPGQDAIEEFKKKADQVPMYVLSNQKNYFGAAVIYYPGVLKKLGETLHSDLILLPSSVHEVILLPVHGGEDPEELNEMIRDINIHQVAEEEVLSDHMYYYDLGRDELRMPSVR